jgi:hypothetical protein
VDAPLVGSTLVVQCVAVDAAGNDVWRTPEEMKFVREQRLVYTLNLVGIAQDADLGCLLGHMPKMTDLQIHETANTKTRVKELVVDYNMTRGSSAYLIHFIV